MTKLLSLKRKEKKLIPGSLLSRCGFTKEMGLSCKMVMTDLLLLCFENKNLYQKAGKDKEMSGNLKTSITLNIEELGSA